MLSILRSTWALMLGIGLLMLGHGLQGTLLGLRANMEGFPSAVTGVVMSGYYIGLLIGSLRVPTLVARVGHVRVFGALLSLGSTTILFQALFVEPVAWFLMRLLTGYCFAGAFIVAESWLNGSATNETRGRLLSLYMVVQMGGMAAGQFLLNLADPRGFDLFILVSVLISIAAVPMLLTAVAAPTVTSPRDIGLLELYRLSPLGVVGIAGVGIANSGLFSMGPVYATQEGLSIAADLDLHGGRHHGRRAVPGAGRAAVGPAGPALGDRRGGHAHRHRRAAARAVPASAAAVPVSRLLPGGRPVAAALCALRRPHQRLPQPRSRWSAPAAP